MNGILYLIPSFIGTDIADKVIPDYNTEIVRSLKFFIVEEERTARRFIKKLCPDKNIDELQFLIFNEHSNTVELEKYLLPLYNGHNIGLLSEAGLPCIADPGNIIVRVAHTKGIEVVPLVGPSAIYLALMASGLNGQNFAFVGYLPIKKNERISAIKFLEQRSLKENQTQCFIETPYRNNQLLEDILNTVHPDTNLCIAVDITLPSQIIITRSIKDWKTKKTDINKHPAIFILKRDS